MSSINLGRGLASLNEGEIEGAIKSLENASKYNDMSEVIETEFLNYLIRFTKWKIKEIHRHHQHYYH